MKAIDDRLPLRERSDIPFADSGEGVTTEIASTMTGKHQALQIAPEHHMPTGIGSKDVIA